MREQTQVAEKMSALRALIFDLDGVITDGGLPYGPDGEAFKIFNTRDNVGIRLAQIAGWSLAVITGRDSPMVAKWAAELNLESVHQGVKDKRSYVGELATKQKLAPESMVYLGDDLLDLPAMDFCGLSAAPADAALTVRHQVDLVLDLGGGRGCLRELVERILEAQGRASEVIAAYLTQHGGQDLADKVFREVGPDGPKIGFRR